MCGADAESCPHPLPIVLMPTPPTCLTPTASPTITPTRPLSKAFTTTTTTALAAHPGYHLPETLDADHRKKRKVKITVHSTCRGWKEVGRGSSGGKKGGGDCRGRRSEPRVRQGKRTGG
ncbi:hypothetical protein E2C01_053874 [Portunus trituberculatus]|uniref:Uncharacterized protein n=1 Tax=Portunus trituberculatus TaxID=210409 RepID=A0A5B7GQI4_PORTR|nr:hypothetical protein [Portunus trituberculatus]